MDNDHGLFSGKINDVLQGVPHRDALSALMAASMLHYFMLNKEGALHILQINFDILEHIRQELEKRTG